MLVIRLQRVGKKNQPSYRIVLAESTAPVKGKFIEILGNYNPRLKTKAFEKDRILHWLSKGAKASPTVHNLLVGEKIIEGSKVKAWTPKRKEGENIGTEAKIEKPVEKPAELAKESAEAKKEKPEEPAKAEDAGETPKGE